MGHVSWVMGNESLVMSHRILYASILPDIGHGYAITGMRYFADAVFSVVQKGVKNAA